MEIVKKQFDVVAGNPPYNSPVKGVGNRGGTTSSFLWDKFLYKALVLLKQDGYLAFITPGGWRKPNHRLLKAIKEKDLIYLETHDRDDGKAIFDAKTPYDWYVVKNTKYSGSTTIKDHNGLIQNRDEKRRKNYHELYYPKKLDCIMEMHSKYSLL